MADDNNRRINIFINGRAVENSLKGIGSEMNKTRAELRRLTIGSDEYNAKVKELRTLQSVYRDQQNAIRGVGQETSRTNKLMGQVKSTLGGIVSPVGLVTGAVAAVGFALNDGIKTMRATEVAMDDLQAITGVTADQMGFFRQKAVEFGKAFGETPVSILEAFKLAGSAKPELLESKEAMAQFTEQALILSKAARIDVTEAVGSLTTIMNANGAAVEETSRYINVLAAGSQKGAKEVDFLAAAFEKIGPVGATAGLSIEQQTAALELLGEKGFNSAETAGTSFRNFLLILQQDERNLTDGKLDLNKAFTNYAGITQDATALTEIFGKENVAQAQALLLNKNRFEELTVAITGTNTAQEQAILQMDNAATKTAQLSAQWDGFWVNMSEDGDSVLGSLSDFASGLLDDIQRTFTTISFVTKSIKSAVGLGGGADQAVANFNVDAQGRLGQEKARIQALAQTLAAEGKLQQYFDQQVKAKEQLSQDTAKYKSLLFEISALEEVLNKDLNEKIRLQAEQDAKAEKAYEKEKENAKDREKAERDRIKLQKERIQAKEDRDFAEGIKEIKPRKLNTGALEAFKTQKAAEVQISIDADKKMAENRKVIQKESFDDTAAKWAEVQEELKQTQFTVAQTALNTVDQLTKISIDKRTTRELRGLEAKKNAGIISEEQYDKKREEIERAAFERKKRLDIAMILMNGAVAALKTYAMVGWPAAIPGLIEIGAQTLGQLAVVSAQEFGDGGMVYGKSHRDGGVPAIMEGGEFVVQKKYVTAETLPILEAANSGKIRYLNAPVATENTRADASGRIFSMNSSASSTRGSDNTAIILAAINQWQREFEVKLPLRELDKANDRKSRVEKLAKVA